jgi:hypothetical protein
MQYYFQVFDYIEELDCFVVNKQYEKAATYLGLAEWSSVVWIGRYFLMDNDFGEHWFDNWDERDKVWQNKKVEQLGYQYDELMVINSDRFKDGKDGPCYTSVLRKKFWTDVLISLRISLSLMIEQARYTKEQTDEIYKEIEKPEDYIEDLESRIIELKSKYTR